MKKKMIYFLLLSLVFWACKKNEMMPYLSADNVYLHYLDKDKNQDTTTISYSFAYNPGLAQDTLWVPVIVTGPKVSHSREFVLSVVDSLTTAVKGTHYEALKTSYTLPADSSTFKIPVILKNTDAALETKSVTLGLRTTAGGDFAADLPLPLRTKKVIFSNRLERPSWWIYWQSELGEYGRIKHQLFLIASGTVDLVDMSKPDAYLQIPRTLYYIDNFRFFLKDPATWIARNPDKGYVLVKKESSNEYEFYAEAAPGKRFVLKYFAQVNSYFFVDENGKQLII
ncbi:DUF4843 domain-containing protein [Pedobacter endophyticus]|uniref:DUF4843 domain-containing protein n=1 Tax=Pedobacter endophyticus TaxID=2789740 RepID=A0A7S9PZ73_9SPHI|nr:DUF4843 domain-containing protein [Pedobacter endophyticus]QPH39635.1 DUF4843 domain-containing protein [Pedobacter endophyticus]